MPWSAALGSNPGMSTQANMGTYVLHEHTFSCQARCAYLLAGDQAKWISSFIAGVRVTTTSFRRRNASRNTNGGEILRLRRVGQTAEEVVVDRARVPLVELAERGTVSTRARAEERLVASRHMTMMSDCLGKFHLTG